VVWHDGGIVVSNEAADTRVVLLGNGEVVIKYGNEGYTICVVRDGSAVFSDDEESWVRICPCNLDSRERY